MGKFGESGIVHQTEPSNFLIFTNIINKKFLLLLCLIFIEEDDYTPGPYNVTFIAGMISVQVFIPIIDDNTLEMDESFTLTIDASSLPSSVTVGDPDQARVTIVEDSGK